MAEINVDVCVLGGGAAGLMCAIHAGRRGRSVVVVEHTEKIGKKILISGGGRCNFTNTGASPRNYISRNPHFCKSALARYTAKDFIELVEAHGIAYHEKKLGQLFCDGSSRAIVAMLESECAAAGVQILVDCRVESGVDGISVVQQSAGGDGGFELRTSHGRIRAASLVVATGGPSIPKMGATGFAYDLARNFGLAIVPTKPALVPVITDGVPTSPNDSLINLPLKNATEDHWKRFRAISGVSLDSIVSCNGASFREHLLFTHRGFSGPAVLQASSYWETGDTMMLNVAPELDTEQFFQEHRTSKITVKNTLASLLPQRFAEEFCEAYEPQLATKPFNTISQKDFTRLAEQLCRWQLAPTGTEGYAKAEVTAGGVDTDELSSKTMESKNVRGLYFIGEAVDVTGWLGGYNFQWAWSSGVAAGQVT